MSAESPQPIEIMRLPVAANVCQQELREVWKDNERRSSIAHVVMEPGASSLLHEHHVMTEVYVISEGQGVLTVGDNQYPVGPETVMEIPTYTPHRLVNTGETPLRHLVLAIPAFNPEDVFVHESEEPMNDRR